MRRFLASLLVAVLASASAQAAAGQSPGPEGELIELVEAGLAVTLPSDWEAKVDADWLRSAEGPGPGAVLATTGPEAETCVVRLTPLDGLGLKPSLEMQVATARIAVASDPGSYELTETRPVQLPVGEAAAFDDATQTVDGDWRFTTYVFEGAAAFISLVCGGHQHRPDDRWLSVAEAFEFLPVASPSYRTGPGPSPSQHQTVLPIFASPFTGSPKLSNWFDHRYPLPFEDGNAYQLNWRGNKDRHPGRIRGHAGYDWLLPKGKKLLAVADGRVIAAGTDPSFYCPTLGRRVKDQRFVEVLHPAVEGEVFSSVYVHLARIDVKVGDWVRQGQRIGLSGNSGCSTEPHLHFQVWRHSGTNTGRPALVDPYGWQPDRPDPWAGHKQGGPSAWLWMPGEAPPLKPRR